jgi:uncharacterized protein YaiI (UPF0178 family)
MAAHARVLVIEPFLLLWIKSGWPIIAYPSVHEKPCLQSLMKIWVDADACPGVIKDILYRAADRAQVQLTLIANQMLRTPPSPWIRALQVPAGFDVADQRIVQEAEAGDLVITADIPLAAQVVAKGAHVLDPRGELLDANNIQERLTMRNFMDSLRSSGVDTGGPAAFSAADRQAFANKLDGLLAKLKNRPS